MRIMTVGRKPIACWLEIDAEGNVKSISRGDVRKDWKRTMGGKASAEEISNTLRIIGESLSKTPRVAPTQSAKQPTNQTNKTENKQ